MNRYPPTPKQFNAYMKRHSLTLRMVCEMTKVSQRTAYNWKEGTHEMPYGSWFTLRTKVEGEPPESQ